MGLDNADTYCGLSDPTVRKYCHSNGNSAATCGWIMRIYTVAYPTVRKYCHSNGNSAATCGWIMQIAPTWQHTIDQASITLLSIWGNWFFSYVKKPKHVAHLRHNLLQILFYLYNVKCLICLSIGNFTHCHTISVPFRCFFLSCKGKCQGIPRKDRARSALFLISELCCSTYCLCVNVYCITATMCQPNCSSMYHIIYHINSYHCDHTDIPKIWEMLTIGCSNTTTPLVTRRSLWSNFWLKRAFLLFHSPHTPPIWFRATSFCSQN